MNNEFSILQERGIQIESENRTPSELIDAGFYKIDSTTTYAIQLDAATKAISSWMMDYSYTKDTYRIHNDLKGRHLGESHQGADYSANIFIDGSEKLDGPVGLDAVGKHFSPTTLINGVFTIMSIATSQYFMTQINSKLEDILDGINEIRQFLEDDKMSELQAGYDELREINTHLKYIKNNSNRTYMCAERIRQIMHIARKDMLFFGKQIESIKNSAGNRDKRELARENASKIIMALSRYRLALSLFCETKLIELYLSDISDPDEMDLFRQEMEDQINGFVETYTISKDWCRRYFLTHNLVGESSNLPFIDSIDAFLSDTKKEENVRFTGKTHARLNSLQADPDDLFIPVKSLARYTDIIRNGVDIVCLHNDVYTNIPIEQI